MAGQNHGLFADQHAKAVEEGLGCPGHHDAGHVVPVKDHRTFDGTLRQHDFFGTHAPHPFTRRPFGNIAHVIGQFLHHPDHVLMIIAHGRGARHAGDVWQVVQLSKGTGKPVPGWLPVDGDGWF